MAVKPHAIRCRSLALPYIQILSGRLARLLVCTSHPAGGCKNTPRLHANSEPKAHAVSDLDLHLALKALWLSSAKDPVHYIFLFSPLSLRQVSVSIVQTLSFDNSKFVSIELSS